MAIAAWGLLASGSVVPDLVATLSRVAVAVVLAASMGVALGFALHGRARVRGAIGPVLSAWYAIPTIMFYPVLLVLFGVGVRGDRGDRGAAGGGGDGGEHAGRAGPGSGGVAADGAGAGDGVGGRWRGGWRLPSAAPYLVTGVKLVVAYAFIGVIASEFILSGLGLGYAIANAYNNFDNSTMYGAMLLIVVVVTGVNTAVGAVDRRFRRGWA